MEQTPCVSVIIVLWGTYLRFLSRALNSLAKQDYPNIETLVIDGGCDPINHDGQIVTCSQLLESYRAAHRMNISYVDRVPCTVVGQASQFGVEAASGRYVMRFDADDELGSTHVSGRVASLMRAQADDPQVALAYGDLRRMRPDGRTEVVTISEEDGSLACHGAGVLFVRSIVMRVGGYDRTLPAGEDTELIANILGKGYRAVRCPGLPSYYYHQTNGGLSADHAGRQHAITLARERHTPPAGILQGVG